MTRERAVVLGVFTAGDPLVAQIAAPAPGFASFS